ncbi:hydroxyacid dehydrogenase [Halomonas sp. DP8Y7-3]|uniref:hydroxyacid dehydrogenase n=1 Tax=Halomonas sp. DP8Y7-3 TaxID=2859079 RepID=UPI001C9455D2|nr:hydroxyacid dehydrogenase [Halomonas sp. DP8Y7-3]MBY5929933.1 hydroxyacid dehydrogenase [Halomonas sp. DP8Y7-3]
MARIVISEFMDERAVAWLAQQHDVVMDPQLVDQPERLREAVSQCEALIVRNRTQVDSALLAAAPHLKVVGRLGVGLDNIALDECARRGIEVKPAQGGNADSVAEYVVTGALMLRRRAYASTEAMLQGQWPRQALMGCEVKGAVMGLVGLGVIARATARLAMGLGMQVQAYDPHVPASDPVWQTIDRCETLNDLLGRADVLSLHVPLVDQTRHLLDRERLFRMKPQSVLINAARGGVVDEAALAEALTSGHLAGAMLDVFEQEPLAAGSVLEGAPNLILTPHIAGVTEESNQRISQMTAENVAIMLTSEEVS